MMALFANKLVCFKMMSIMKQVAGRRVFCCQSFYWLGGALCFLLMCPRRELLRLLEKLHWSHLLGFSPVYVSLCLFRGGQGDIRPSFSLRIWECFFFLFSYLTFVFSKRFTFLKEKIVNHFITDANLVRASVFSNHGNRNLFPLNWILLLLQIRSISGKLQKAEEARFRDWTGRGAGSGYLSLGKSPSNAKNVKFSIFNVKRYLSLQSHLAKQNPQFCYNRPRP